VDLSKNWTLLAALHSFFVQNILWQCWYQKGTYDTSLKIDFQRSTHPAFGVTILSSNRKIVIFYPWWSLIAKLISINELGIYGRNQTVSRKTSIHNDIRMHS
jgi:hypothetical protein